MKSTTLLLLAGLATGLLAGCASTSSDRMEQREQTLEKLHYSAPGDRGGSAELSRHPLDERPNTPAQ